ncbi:FG-GAP-like repeat-containing protein [Microbulbifer aggregans]|uniref:FG-GAP-like repeat-containing protein n=1 Tax=Microbulbifer aggregans TaxID=1769779 RepID=UPI001CFF4393|nr:FG-GAP-like repeat-containing protein [Microbulbifer aggregans]
MKANVASSDPDNDALTTTFTWSVNSHIVNDATGETLPSEHYVKNDLVTLVVEVSDGELSASKANEITISDSLPTPVGSSVPKTVEYGIPTTFTIGAEDADGDEVSVRLVTRPNGMTLAEDGTVTWTPTGPMFDTTQEVHWTAILEQGDLRKSFGSAITVVDENRQVPLSRSGIIFSGEITSGDFNGDGTEELLASDYNQRLFTIGHDENSYQQNWMYPFALPGGGKISYIAAGDIDGDGIDEMFIGLNKLQDFPDQEKTQILIIDGQTRRLRDTIHVSGDIVQSIRIADVNNDDQQEIVTLITKDYYSDTEYVVEVRQSSDFSLIWQSSPLAQENALATGDTDGDGTEEIILSGGYIFGYNGTTFTNEWLFGDGAIYAIDAADLDGDGTDEIIALSNGNSSYQLTIYDALNKTVKAEIVERFSSFHLSDIDGDKTVEIFAIPYSAYEARLLSFDSSTAQFSTQWALSLPFTGKCLVANISGDSGKEFVIFDGGLRSRILVAGANPEPEIEWQNDDIHRITLPFEGGELANFNGNGNRLVFFAKASSILPTYSTYGARAIQLDPVNGKLEWSPALAANVTGTVTDQGQDGSAELLYFSGDTLSLYSFFTQSLIWNYSPIGGAGGSVAKGRLNTDLEDDLVILTGDGNIIGFDPKNQAVLWEEERESGRHIALGDLNGDLGYQVVIADNHSLSMYSAGESGVTPEASQSLEALAPLLTEENYVYDFSTSYITSLAIGDFEGDGNQEVVFAASSTGEFSWLVILNNDLSPRKILRREGSVQGLLVQNYGTGHHNLLVNEVSDINYFSHSQFIEISPESGQAVSKSPLVPTMNMDNSMYFVDTNGDGIPELSYGSSIAMNVTR